MPLPLKSQTALLEMSRCH